MIADRFGLPRVTTADSAAASACFTACTAAEVFEQTASRALADARNLQQFGGAVAHLPALAMEGHGEAVGFVANELNQMQHRRVMVERDGIFLLP